MRGRTRSIGSIVTFVAAIVLLAGCDSFAADPVAVTLVEGTPIARFCLPGTITGIYVKTYDSENSDDNGSRARIVWSASGSTTVSGGDELPIGVAPPGMESTFDGGVDFQSMDFSFNADVIDSYGLHHFYTYVEGAELTEDVWVNTYGVVDVPCIRDTCPPGYACNNQWPQPTGAPTKREPTWVPTASPEP
jgi:hypothetical protein